MVEPLCDDLHQAGEEEENHQTALLSGANLGDPGNHFAETEELGGENFHDIVEIAESDPLEYFQN